jgi:hypothetical protein
LERRLSELETEAAEAKAALASATATAAAVAIASAKNDLFGATDADVPARKTRVARRAAAPLLEPEVEVEAEVEAAAEPDVKRSAPAKATKVEKPVAMRRALKTAPLPETEPAQDDQPIEWWLPSFRAARTTGAERKRKTR